MIRWVDGSSEASFLAACSLDPAAGCHAYTDYLANRNQSLNAGAWLAQSETGGFTGALSLSGGRFYLALRPEADWGEILEFAGIVGAKSLMSCDPRAKELPGAQAAPLLAFTGEPEQDMQTIPSVAPTAVYKLLSRYFEGFDADYEAWLTDTSYKMRRGLITVLGAFEEEGLAATAGVYAQNADTALLSAVVTDPAFRGRGLASSLVRTLCAIHREQRCVILPINAYADRLYRNIGFVPIGTVFTAPL